MTRSFRRSAAMRSSPAGISSGLTLKPHWKMVFSCD